jgi:hypothetical protein
MISALKQAGFAVTTSLLNYFPITLFTRISLNFLGELNGEGVYKEGKFIPATDFVEISDDLLDESAINQYGTPELANLVKDFTEAFDSTKLLNSVQGLS